MTRDEAEALDLELNRHLKNCSEDMGIEEPFYDCVMGNIIISPEPVKKDMIVLADHSFSIKPGNIRLDLRAYIYIQNCHNEIKSGLCSHGICSS